MGVTSSDIKKALAQKHHRDFFMAEVKSGSTWNSPVGNLMILDGLAIAKSWTNPCFTGYEIKISRSDFLRDAKFYTYEILVNCLYIVCPKGMIDRKIVLENASNRDVVEVIRCRDCKHYDCEDGDQKCVKDAEWVEEDACYYGFISYHGPEFFCADGERKDER